MESCCKQNSVSCVGWPLGAAPMPSRLPLRLGGSWCGCPFVLLQLMDLVISDGNLLASHAHTSGACFLKKPL